MNEEAIKKVVLEAMRSMDSKSVRRLRVGVYEDMRK